MSKHAEVGWASCSQPQGTCNGRGRAQPAKHLLPPYPPQAHTTPHLAPSRAAGDVERDFWLSLDLLKSPKDHHEFVTVRDWIRSALQGVAREVTVEVPKSVLKQVRVRGAALCVSGWVEGGACRGECVWGGEVWPRSEAPRLEVLHGSKIKSLASLSTTFHPSTLTAALLPADPWALPGGTHTQGSMQHLYGRLAAQLLPDINDAHLLKALHPTPAVCGRPREGAFK